jgi:branched-chain amino acid transport system permease protein
VLNIAAVVFFAGAVVFGIVYGLQGDRFYIRLATEALIFGGLALSVDILLGVAGLLSLGQALYFGLGAYTAAVMLKYVGENFWLALFASSMAGIAAGWIGGVIAIRARGVYFVLITYGLAQIVAKVIYNTREIDLTGLGGSKLFIGASDGITGIPIIRIPLGFMDTKADSPAGFFFVTLVLVGLVYLALVYLARTPFGRALAGVRINEKRLPFLGYRPERLKLAAFVLAGGIAGLAGGLYPMLRWFVSPELMYFEASTNAIVAAIIGGAGTLIGPLYGSVILVFLKSIIGTITHHHLMVIGAVFMIAVIFMPKGIIGYLRDWYVARIDKGRGGEA